MNTKEDASNGSSEAPETAPPENLKSNCEKSTAPPVGMSEPEHEKPDFTEGPLTPASLKNFVKKNKNLHERMAQISDDFGYIWDWLFRELAKSRSQVISDLRIEPGTATSSVQFDGGDPVSIARQSADLLGVLAADTPSSANGKDPLVAFKSVDHIREMMIQRGHSSMTNHYVSAAISRLKKLLEPWNLQTLIETRTVDRRKMYRCRLKRSGWNPGEEALSAA